MSDFGIERFSGDAQRRMTTALKGVGLVVEPELDQVDRSETVVLSLPCPEPELREPAPPSTLAQVLTIRTASQGRPLERVALDAPPPAAGSGIRWFDIADSGRVGRPELERWLGPICNGDLTESMLDDVLSPDPRPKIKEHRTDPRVVCVSAFRVSARESDEGAEPDSTSKAGVLVFEPVEFLVGSDWLVTCWHDIEVYRGADRIREDPPTPPGELFAQVERRWPQLSLRSAGDLALLVLHELTLTYEAAYRQFYDWEEEWELDFYRRPERVDRATLLEIRAASAVLRDWLNPLSRSGVREDVDKAWFPGITGTPAAGGHGLALRVDEQIERSLKELREFADTLRSAYDLLQLREADRERERDDKFQRNIAVGGSAILIPTLVAGIMGANTWVPGQWRESGPPPHWAFLVLLGIVITSGAIAWGAIHWIQSRDERGP